MRCIHTATVDVKELNISYRIILD